MRWRWVSSGWRWPASCGCWWCDSCLVFLCFLNMPFKKGQPGGPGRPRKTDQNAGAVARAEKQIRDRLPSLIDNMLILADGGYERVEEQWARADSLYIGSGASATRMYPDLPDDELVLVKRTVSIADRDRAANQYLIDRIMGKPTERQELDHSGAVQISVRYE